MVSRRFIDSRRRIMPGRVSVEIFQRQKRDQWAQVTEGILAERRPATEREVTGEASGSASQYDYVFFSAELEQLGDTTDRYAPVFYSVFSQAFYRVEAVKLQVGDVIYDPGSVYPWNCVESINYQLQGRRQHCVCSQTVDPRA